VTITATQRIIPSLAKTLAGFGDILECQTCKRTRPLGDIGAKLRGGWPECHGQTMCWVTEQQLEQRKGGGGR
jgi:hypothetical protein